MTTDELLDGIRVRREGAIEFWTLDRPDRMNALSRATVRRLGALARQARQAARYRAIGDELRQSEGLLLYRRWKEADEARAAAGRITGG